MQSRRRRLAGEHSQALLALLDANARMPGPIPLLLETADDEEEDQVWARRALHVYHDALADGYKPQLRSLERLLSCLRLPQQPTALPAQSMVLHPLCCAAEQPKHMSAGRVPHSIPCIVAPCIRIPMLACACGRSVHAVQWYAPKRPALHTSTPACSR